MSGLFLCSPHSLDTALLSTSLKMPFSLLLHLMNLGQQSLSCNSISTENSHQSNQSHLKQFEQELPQVGGGALPGLALAGDPVRPHLGRPGLLLGPLELGLVRAGEGDGVGGVVAGVRVRVGGRRTRTCGEIIYILQKYLMYCWKYWPGPGDPWLCRWEKSEGMEGSCGPGPVGDCRSG